MVAEGVVLKADKNQTAEGLNSCLKSWGFRLRHSNGESAF